MKITIKGVTRDERRRVLDLIDEALRTDEKYRFSGGEYPFEGDVSSQTYGKVDMGKTYSDMSAGACMARYDAKRQEIVDMIRTGKVSASMSGIEYYPFSAKDADIEKDPFPIKIAMTWNGQTHVDRDGWKTEFKEWQSAQ